MDPMIPQHLVLLLAILLLGALGIPYVLPRIGAAIGMLITGYGASLVGAATETGDAQRFVGTVAAIYGLLWLAIGLARYATVLKGLVEATQLGHKSHPVPRT